MMYFQHYSLILKFNPKNANFDIVVTVSYAAIVTFDIAIVTTDPVATAAPLAAETALAVKL